jgi:aspartyl protease family protein
MSAGSNVVWVGVGLIALAFLAPSPGGDGGERPVPPKARSAAPAGQAKPPVTAGPAAASGFGQRSIERADDGHFYVEAQVNGARVQFLVDTGASMVALTPADARRAGIALSSVRAVARGAGGEIEIVPVAIDRIAVGTIEARNVGGAVIDDLPVSLLGQSFLGTLSGVEISGDRMVLR